MNCESNDKSSCDRVILTTMLVDVAKPNVFGPINFVHHRIQKRPHWSSNFGIGSFLMLPSCEHLMGSSTLNALRLPSGTTLCGSVVGF